jgi:riboflavin kinase/FMN adenylyltransferase
VATLEQNLRQFRRLGVSICVILPFERAMADTSADAFAAMVLDDALRAKQIVVGHDFAFGRGRAGTPEWLSHRYETVVVEPFLVDGVRVSSSAVRAAVAQGQMAEAAKWLGRPFALAGVVVAGQKLGRTLGFPTANLALAVDQVLPGDGVYSGWAHYDGLNVEAAISVGTRPTVDGQTRLVEAFLLEPPREPLYAKAMEVAFHAKIRDQIAFDSLDLLTAQMHKDVAEVRLNLANALVGK